MKLARENRKKKPVKVKGKYSSRFPLLVKRAAEWGYTIPENQPIGTAVIVWRLPPVHEHRIPGTKIDLLIPDEHDSPHSKGILIAASARALESLESQGVSLGHIVQWKRFAGEEQQEAGTARYKPQRILWLQASDILASDDLMGALETGKADYKKDGGKLLLDVDGDIPGAKKVKQISARKQKLLALAERGGTPAERETAARIAARS